MTRNNTQDRRTATGFLVFVALGFGPLVLGYLLMVVPLSVMLLSGRGPEGSGTISAAEGAGLALVGLIMVLTLPATAFTLARKSSSWFAKGLLLYVCWQPLVFLLAYFAAGALAGVSMAAVDGAVTKEDLRVQALTFAAHIWPLAQILIIPWLTGTMILIKRFTPEMLSPQPGPDA